MIDRIAAHATHHGDAVGARIDVPHDGSYHVWWRAAGGDAPSADFLLPLTLLVAMRTGRDLFLDGEISQRMLDHVPRLQAVFHGWDSSLVTIEVMAAATRRREPDRQGAGSAAFFSGGVDSFYTALTRRATLDALVFVAGFDIRPTRATLLARVARANACAARELGLPLLHVTTNLREFSHRYLTWSEYHGSAMAATAHVLGLRHCYHPGSLSPGNDLPYGSHPDLDHLWSSETTQISYDAYPVSRLDKTRAIAGNGVALRYLRVCNSRDDDGYNCGRCEKCLRTLVALRIAGRCGSLPTFERGLDLGDVATRRRHRIPALWQQNVDAAVAEDSDPALVDALLRSVGRAPVRQLARPPRPSQGRKVEPRPPSPGAR